MNSEKLIGLYAFFLVRQPQRDQFQSLCGSEVTRKIKQLEVEEGHVLQCSIAGNANVCSFFVVV